MIDEQEIARSRMSGLGHERSFGTTILRVRSLG